MRDLEGAMKEEKLYIADKMNGIETSFLDRLLNYDYTSLSEYFQDKYECLFNEWIPDVHYINADFLDNGMETAIIENRYGVYILTPEEIYAFHGNDEIDYDLCNELKIRVIEMNYTGGTIIGSDADLGILLVMPKELETYETWILDNFLRIINKYIENAKIAGNDIVADGKKVLGSMSRRVGNSYVWAAQVSFKDYSELIEKVCNKTSKKKPGYIASSSLTRSLLEEEVLKWLRKL